MRWFGMLIVCVMVIVAIYTVNGELWEEDDHEVLIRNERGTKNREPCKYSKGAWSECNPATNMRSRELTLKKGDPSICEKSKTIQKKCKKACRYERGTWSECNGQSEMTRIDKLKPNSDVTCQQSREITKKCKNKKGVKPSKMAASKGGRRNRP